MAYKDNECGTIESLINMIYDRIFITDSKGSILQLHFIPTIPL